MDQDPEDKRLADLDKRIREARAEDQSVDRSKEGKAWSMGAEFVGSVLAGAAIGYGLDRWFGSAPWAMIAFLLLGFAAGTRNALRRAGNSENDNK